VYPKVKRFFDATAAALLMVVTAPIQLAAAVAVALTMGRPIFFRQKRAGLGGTTFSVLKFRTMVPESEAPSDASAAERVTPLGRVLRSSSIDELPSIVNVLKGDMSLVGPRPLPVRYLPRYTTEQYRRHEVRPGITGLAQVSGRNSVDWSERLALDIEYVQRFGPRIDFWILLKTVKVVLCREGINVSGDATMHEFRGVDP
jgi:lipopolysaccharide/colanic/teichoic acid biosynthesis glycosyltransferase